MIDFWMIGGPIFLETSIRESPNMGHPNGNLSGFRGPQFSNMDWLGNGGNHYDLTDKTEY